MAKTPFSDYGDMAPTSLRHLIGQDGVKRQVQVAVDAAFADNGKFDPALLLGPPGLGKTALARIIAMEMAVDFHEFLGQSLTRACDLHEVLLAAKDKDVLHIDEAHQLSKQLQTSLYTALDQRKLIAKVGGAGGRPVEIRIADFTLLLSTTDEFSLLQPLRDRARLVLRFQFNSPAQLTEIVRIRSRAMGWDVAEEIFSQIAERARGTPRLALRLLQASRRVCRAAGESLITIAHFEKACSLEGIDDLGLGPAERQYLRLVGAGTGRLGTLASILGLPPRTVQTVIEPFLLRAGLICKDDHGTRLLTPRGCEHVGNVAEVAR